jgi:hypothetical protein
MKTNTCNDCKSFSVEYCLIALMFCFGVGWRYGHETGWGAFSVLWWPFTFGYHIADWVLR